MCHICLRRAATTAIFAHQLQQQPGLFSLNSVLPAFTSVHVEQDTDMALA